jgi:hypothetical protein
VIGFGESVEIRTFGVVLSSSAKITPQYNHWYRAPLALCPGPAMLMDLMKWINYQ